MIHLDTCVLVDALTGPHRSAGVLRAFIERGERISFSALVLYEWAKGSAVVRSCVDGMFGPRTPSIVSRTPLHPALSFEQGRQYRTNVALFGGFAPHH